MRPAISNALLLPVLLYLCVAAAIWTQVSEALSTVSLIEGDTMVENDEIRVLPYSLVMQSDCNLVLYHGSQPLWASSTQNDGSHCYFVLQADGNAVVYSAQSAGKSLFATNTCCRKDGGHILSLQSDGNLVMYNGSGNAIWPTHTWSRR